MLAILRTAEYSTVSSYKFGMEISFIRRVKGFKPKPKPNNSINPYKLKLRSHVWYIL